MGQTAEDQPEQYWYNIKTGMVEKGRLSAAIYRVGPFPTEAEAKAAMSTLRQRSDAWKSEEDSEN